MYELELYTRPDKLEFTNCRSADGINLFVLNKSMKISFLDILGEFLDLFLSDKTINNAYI